ncbi:MAG: phosphatase PAP2 family protein [Caulobacteraceae bacterium]|nr:phosphatase PAP2 family protein [Caulobacteraceae bacterium]
MRRRWGLTAGVGAVCAAAAVALAQSSPTGGYLAGHEPDTVAVVPQAPAPESPRDVEDRAIFKATRALQGSPRWTLAQNDAVVTIPAVLKDFSCAAGVALSEQKAPALVTILKRLSPDIAAAYSTPKDLYRRPRPYMRDEGPICTPRSKALDETFDYPSGHATFAWTYGLILAELIPDRAGPILQRARAFGESRAVCGVHSASAVTEARTAASTLFAALQASPAFQEDLRAARMQLASLREAPEPNACRTEEALTARTPW